MKERIEKFLDKVLPPAKYSNGKQTSCILYRCFNLLDPVDD